MASGSYILNRKKFGRPSAMLWSENSGTLQNGLYIPQGYEVDSLAPDGTSPDLLDQFIITSDHNRSALDFKVDRIEQRERMINGRMRSYYVDDKLTISTSWSMIPSRAFKKKPNWEADFRQVYVLGAVGDGSNIKYKVSGTSNTFAVGEKIDISGTNITGYNVKNATITDVGVEDSVHYITIKGSAIGMFYANTSNGVITVSGVGLSSFTDDFDKQYTVDGGAGGLDLLEWYENHSGPFWVFLAYDKFTNFDRNDNASYEHLKQYNEVIEMYISDFSYNVEKRGGIYDFWNVSVSLEEV